MTTTIDPSQIPQPKLHGYLLSAVAPRPICFASTIDSKGNVNLSPFSFFNVFSSNPPIMIFSPARRGRDNTTKHTYENILEVKETVINIVNHDIVEQMSLSSNEYAKGVSEFEKAGLTQVESTKIKPPRVGESPVAFECTVDQVIPLGDGGGAGNLIIARVVLIHINNQYLDDQKDLDTVKLDLVARMGDNWYCRAQGDALFEIPKPLREKGIGIDQLPEHARTSNVLSGNDLARLGSLASLPKEAELEKIKQEKEIQRILEEHQENEASLKKSIHLLCKKYLREGNTQRALEVLMVVE